MAYVPTDAASVKRVLISYAQESDEHRSRVLRLANQLRSHGVDAMIDQYEPHPPEGWPKWMKRQISGVDFVLVVFTETYWLRAEGHEQPGRGLGVAWEADLIDESLYETPHENRRFIPLLYSPEHEKFIVTKLRSVTRYVLDENNLALGSTGHGYDALYRHITDQPLVVKPVVGRLIKLDAINGSSVAPTTIPLDQPGSQAIPSLLPRVPASKGIVLMAEARSDVKQHADNFTRFLREEGYEILVPEPFTHRSDIRPSFEAALKECLLVVQVLGEDPFPRSKFLDGVRFEQWIKRQSQVPGKAVITWRPPSLDVSLVVDEDYQQLLTQDVVACDAEDFKALLKERLAATVTKPRETGRHLFVHHHTRDRDSADEVGGTAEDLGAGIKVDLTNEQVPVAAAIGSDPVHGLMLIYGNCGEDWAESSFEALKVATDAANNRHKLKPPPRAIVRTSTTAPKLRRRPPRWKEIDAHDQAAIESFVRLVKGGEGQS